jgi:hypothetical protein
MLFGCYMFDMANLQVKNIPLAIHRGLHRQAKLSGCTVRDLVLEAVTRQLERERFSERLGRRKPTELGTTAAALLEEARAEHNRT